MGLACLSAQCVLNEQPCSAAQRSIDVARTPVWHPMDGQFSDVEDESGEKDAFKCSGR
ncbi:hypothetical protein MHBO_004569 [Bonamia ostreae]|uniref:Uncharacterized protein n=1 Tax=Bonamia ostreae TaxID=126728 RepID=A0ABV2AUD2_9EUKA